MKLTRRRTLLGLVGASSVVGLGTYELTGGTQSGDGSVSNGIVDGLLTAADVVFPVETRSKRSSISNYVDGLNDDRTRALLGTLSGLDRAASRRFGSPFRSLSRGEAKRLFAVLGVDRVQSRPEGTLPERVRFHVVNSVLYALLTHPTGTESFDVGNPVGYPGGIPTHTD